MVKKFVFIIVVVFVVSADVLASELLFLDRNDLITCEDLSQTLKELLGNNPDKKLVFYVHGRGKYPERAYSYLYDFQSKYDAVTITFIWDAWTSYLTRPVDNAIEVAPRLLYCLGEFQKFKVDNPYLFRNRSTHLLIHSMGNIILKEIIENYPHEQLQSDLFDTVIINSADVPSKNHKVWLSQVRLSPKLYVTINGEDAVLNASNIIDWSAFYSRRLGTYLEDPLIPSEDSNIKVSYLDFDKITFWGHRHFLIPDEKDRYVNRIFRHIFDSSQQDYPVKYKLSNKYPNVWYFFPD